MASKLKFRRSWILFSGPSFLGLIPGVILFFVLPPHSLGRDLLLRDLTLNRDVTIVHVSQHAVVCSNDQVIPWHQILDGNVEDTKKQQAFDTRVKQYGLPLYRFFHRLQIDDPNGAAKLAADIFETEVTHWRSVQIDTNKQTSSQLTLAVQAKLSKLEHQQRFWIAWAACCWQLKQGERPKALVAFLVACDQAALASSDDLQRARLFSEQLGQPSLLKRSSIQLGFHPSLQPVWFDRQATKKSLKLLMNYFQPDKPETAQRLLTPGLQLYLASLNAAVNLDNEAQQDKAMAMLRQIDLRTNLLGELPQNETNQTDLASFSAAVENVRGLIYLAQSKNGLATRAFESANQASPNPLSQWQLQRQPIDEVEQERASNIADTNQADQVIQLLTIVANDGDEFPHIAGGALSQAIDICEKVGDIKTADRLKWELVNRYSFSFHAKKLKSLIRKTR